MLSIIGNVVKTGLMLAGTIYVFEVGVTVYNEIKLEKNIREKVKDYSDYIKSNSDNTTVEVMTDFIEVELIYVINDGLDMFNTISDKHRIKSKIRNWIKDAINNEL
ncbi:hypothetical protein NP274_00060 [Pseudomonas phage Koomba boorn-mokiny kep-wari Wadjak 1]|uniref:Phage protein n=1 Tax=Pseudomonas phage vB_PaeM_FBPa36 TaxID=3231237 RepID=A0AAU8KSM6_9VIRU|nr:hypothetical protein NP274_00060 [Pseudomonas phage Koomba boorn-mokiny kep-wari Wadjak 1]